MSSRRSFFKSLGALVAGAAIAPQVFIPKADDCFRWKRHGEIWVVNPEWINAPYELSFIEFPGIAFAVDSVPFRYAVPDMNSTPIPPYVCRR